MAWGVGEEGEATVPDGGEEGKGGVVEDASVEADMWQKGSWRVRNKELEDEWESEKLEKHIQDVELPIINFALKSTKLGDLIDSKSKSTIDKVVQQVGFLLLRAATF